MNWRVAAEEHSLENPLKSCTHPESPKELCTLCCEVHPGFNGFTTFYDSDLSGFKL